MSVMGLTHHHATHNQTSAELSIARLPAGLHPRPQPFLAPAPSPNSSFSVTDPSVTGRRSGDDCSSKHTLLQVRVPHQPNGRHTLPEPAHPGPGRGRGAKDTPRSQGRFRLFTAIKKVAAQKTSLNPSPRPLSKAVPSPPRAGMQQAEGDALGRGTERGSRFLTLLAVGSGNKCSGERWP